MDVAHSLRLKKEVIMGEMRVMGSTGDTKVMWDPQKDDEVKAAEAQFDIRLTPGSHQLRVVEQIKELVKESGIEGLEVDHRDFKPEDTAGFSEVPDSSFAKQFTDVIYDITGKPVNKKILTGGTDGISTSRISGIPSLGYGTSLTGQAHQPNERITIENLVLGVKIYTAFPLEYK